MARLFYCTFNRSNELFYDGYFIEYDEGKIVGYTHDGILTGTLTSEILETNENTYIQFPIEDGYIEDRHQLVYDYDKDNITVTLYENPYESEREEAILESMLERAKRLPVDVQIALEEFLEE